MKRYIAFLITLVLVSCSPDEFLDVVPTGSLIPTTVDDYDNLLEDYNTSSPTQNNLTYMDPDTWMPGKSYNDLWRVYWKRQYEWSETPYTSGQTDSDWTNRYVKIMVYNTIIEGIDEAPLGNKTEADRLRVKAEAYAQRAYDLFLLVNEYAAHYSPSNLDAPGIPMPLKVDLTAQLSHSTIGEVYAQIESDLTTAVQNITALPDLNVEANFRPGKVSVYGFKALLALYKGDFETARVNADKALNMYDYLYDYTELTNYVPGNAWSGLSIFDFDYSTDNKNVIWNRYHRWTYYDPAQLYHPDLAALFDKDNDQRFILFSSDKTYFGDDVSPNHAYARYYAESQSGLSVPDLLLISAEAKVRTGDGAGAIERLNTLLEKRILNFTPLTHTDNTTTLQLVKDERRKELMATGKNWLDLKRYHAYGETIPTFTRDINGQTYTLEPGSDKYIVPISLKVRTQNPNLN